MAKEIILKYSASAYQAKINSLDNCISQLTTHLNTLEEYEKSLTSFWDDPQAAQFAQALAKQIIKVGNAMNQVTELKRLYQENVDRMTRQSTAIEDATTNLEDTIDRTIEIAGTVAEFL